MAASALWSKLWREAFCWCKLWGEGYRSAVCCVDPLIDPLVGKRCKLLGSVTTELIERWLQVEK